MFFSFRSALVECEDTESNKKPRIMCPDIDGDRNKPGGLPVAKDQNGKCIASL